MSTHEWVFMPRACQCSAWIMLEDVLVILCLCGTFLLYYERVSGLQPQCLVGVCGCVC